MNRLRALTVLAALFLGCFNPVGPGGADGSFRPDVAAFSPDGSRPDASIPDGGSEDSCFMYSELPTCADGSFLFSDRLCLQMSGGLMCAEQGNGQCYPFCDANGGCAAGSTCGEIMLYRCTHYCWKAVRVCFPGPDVQYGGCEPMNARDAGMPPDAAAVDGGPCVEDCTEPGKRECVGGRSRTCVADFWGCRTWSPFVDCPTGSCASTDSCTAAAEHPWPMYRQSRDHAGRSKYAGPSSPTLRWALPLSLGQLVNSSAAVAADGTLFVGSNDSKVYAVDSNGTVRWSFATKDIVRSSPAIGSDGTVYVGSNDGTLYALKPEGTAKWTFATGGPIVSSPTLGADGAIYFASDDHKVYVLEPGGSLRWSFTTGDYVQSAPALGADGTVYVSSDDRYLYALTSGGALLWKFDLAGGTWGSPAVGGDGTIFVGTFTGSMWAVAADGKKRWSFFENGNIAMSPAIGADGTVYFGCFDLQSLAWAYTPDGAQKWQFQATSEFYGSPAIDANGVVYFTDGAGRLLALTSQGTQKWVFDPGGSGPRYVNASPAIGADGTLYFGDSNGVLYAVGK